MNKVELNHHRKLKQELRDVKLQLHDAKKELEDLRAYVSEHKDIWANTLQNNKALRETLSKEVTKYKVKLVKRGVEQ